MDDWERRLIRHTIEDVANELHELKERLFYQVEAKLCEHGKPKPWYDPSIVARVREARKKVAEADEILVKLTMRGL